MALGRKTGGRRRGSPNKRQAVVIAEAQATGALPHEISLAKAREYRERELRYRQAAETPNIAPELQKQYIVEADRLAVEGEIFCKNAAPFYAPKLHRVAGDKDAPLFNGPPIVQIVQYREDDCK